jgi:hypothetical protein
MKRNTREALRLCNKVIREQAAACFKRDPKLRIGHSELYNILTALRGPDVNDYDALKDATTAIIRGVALPAVSLVGAIVNDKDKRSFVESRTMLRGGHFISHAEEAFTALGLKWNRFNKIRRL